MPSQLPVINGPEFNVRLIELMRERRISTESLARQTGISVRLLRKYRAGRTVPRDYFGQPTANLVRIAKVLNVETDALLGASPEQPDPLDRFVDEGADPYAEPVEGSSV